ncbi:chromosome segregation protein SMC [candidate division KSB1 bacterium]|nr:MAG: chromosome segregation protein SMC [candidate division KSB1 bacterium]MBC6950226.1 chromosome segregation protein SMC [candidate division KSB1 bacterium]MCE7942075.1 chromosome segregation protein SMC [Chlorobi bacterium CHB1]MDL1878202.1 chromosome segregation protein SMC [Cytophagia bacterium CHB2]
MITKVTLRNFKSIKDQSYEFSHFDLLVGRNNSGKSTVLQALAIWQFCIDSFSRTKRSGSTGMQVVLPNFTALPVPEFNLLWTERTERRYPETNGKKRQEFILIEIEVTWQTATREELTFSIKLRYNSPQAIYAIPSEGWGRFRELAGDVKKSKPSLLPTIVYVPPFSGLEDVEEWRDDGPMRQQVGKAQPGRVLRNLLLRVWEKYPDDWSEIQTIVKRWFSVDLQQPKYEHGVDTKIICDYKQEDRSYDIISGGSGFHQTLTLLAFLFGYKPTTILLDEPDAHLHVNLQREILDYFQYFKNKSSERNTQFLIATHAEEFIRGVDVSQIYSFLYQDKTPRRVQSTPEIITAMADVANIEIAQLRDFPTVLYVEGETDERLLRAWAPVLSQEETLRRVCFHFLRGGSKQDMRDYADRHFSGVKQIIPQVIRIILFDFDDAENAFHPTVDNDVLYEWQRKNIENYLLIPDLWIRAALHLTNLTAGDDLFAQPIKNLIVQFFSDENLTLPPGKTWKNLTANIFSVVDGKKLLFENKNSLFQRLRNLDPRLELKREILGSMMKPDEVHEDIHRFFDKLEQQVRRLSQRIAMLK